MTATVAGVSDVSPPPRSEPGAAPPPPPPPNLTPPPGYVGYQHAPTTSGIRRIGGLATAITITAAIAGVSTIVAAFVTVSRQDAAREFLANDDEDAFQSAIAPMSAVQMLTSVATLACGVLTIIWMFRIASNVRAYGRLTTWSPLFAIFGWFLPPMVLYVIPFLMLRELWKASDAVLDGTANWKRNPDSPLLWAWFVLFGVLPAILLMVQIGNFAAAGLPTGDLSSLADTIIDFGALGWISAVLTAAAAIVWILFVRQLTRRHGALTNER